MRHSREEHVNTSPAVAVHVEGHGNVNVAAAVSSSLPSNSSLHRTVPEEFHWIPEARDLKWQDDFFDDDDDVIAVFDFDYKAMQSFKTKVQWAEFCVSILEPFTFIFCILTLSPCFFHKTNEWSANAMHVAVTRDAIRHIVDRHRAGCGMACSDKGKTTKTVPFDKITDCNVVEPAGNTCVCVKNVLTTVSVDTASSSAGAPDLRISGLKDPLAFKRLVLAMKRAHRTNGGILAPEAIAMVDRGNGAPVAEPTAIEMAGQAGADQSAMALMLREIRDELRQYNAHLTASTAVSPSAAPLAS